MAKNWQIIHIVGDSALILNMMKQYHPPKSKKLVHWYRLAIRLVDQCRVESWGHQYRSFNEVVDWLTNKAMDTERSVTQITGSRKRSFKGRER